MAQNFLQNVVKKLKEDTGVSNVGEKMVFKCRLQPGIHAGLASSWGACEQRIFAR